MNTNTNESANAVSSLMNEMENGTNLLKDLFEICGGIADLSMIPVLLLIKPELDVAIVFSKILALAAKGFLSISDKLDYLKMSKFCNGTYVDAKTKGKFCEKMRNDTNTCYRMLEVIRKQDDERKIKFICNAVRYYITYDDQNTEGLFRICNAISTIVYEDLVFVKQHIFEHYDESFDYSTTVHALSNNCVMIYDQTTTEGVAKYKFTPFAKALDQYSLSYDDENRYPNPERKIENDLSLEPTHRHAQIIIDVD